MLDPNGRVALVSGASRGIGLAIVRRLLADGFFVCAGARSTVPLSDPNLLVAHYEATDPASAPAWVAAAVARFGRIDAVVNTAGINPVFRVLDEDESAADQMFLVNTKGPLRVVRAAWPHLVAAGHGRIVNIASLSGKRVGSSDNVGYQMSKFALVGATQAMRKAGWKHGIRASALCPGFVRTDMTADSTLFAAAAMSEADDVAALAAQLLLLPDNAVVAELLVNCRLEDTL
ncbi:MAG: SDR family NAD(P)-dependent oxidoreductase [Acetobacteraceae bacterium]|nr:SDR family NAD(P)-dependent oxidoreductase [Acetobacteraceae bacterium]